MYKEIVVGTEDVVLLDAITKAIGRARLLDVRAEPVMAESGRGPILHSFDRIYFSSLDIMREATQLRNTRHSVAWLGIKEGVVKKPNGYWYDVASVQAIGRSGKIIFAWALPVQRERKTDFRSRVVERGVIALFHLPTHHSHQSKVATNAQWRQEWIAGAVVWVLKDAKKLGWFR